MRAKAKTIDEYLAAVSKEQRAALEKLRKAIRAAAPQAEECISYGLAAFKLNGRPLVAFGATANHCAFFPMDSTTVAAFQKELRGFETSKGTIRFQPDKPLPPALVRKLVKSKMADLKAWNPKAGNAQTDAAVAAFLRDLDHPLKTEIEAVRKIILGVSPEIREGIKWNSPSFRTTEFFATLNLRAKDGEERVWLILHRGAKVKDNSQKMTIADPHGLLEWLAADRCLVTFSNRRQINSRKAALAAIVREWIRQL